MSDKMRVDAALVAKGLISSREKAQAAIMAGEVYIGERKVLKPSESFESSASSGSVSTTFSA